MTDPRPQTLATAVESCQGDFDHFLKYALPEFVDLFKETARSDRERLFIDEPISTGIPEFDAWVCAVAEYLANRSGFRPPTWVDRDEGCLLSRPWFPPRREHSKGVFLVESPTEFRRRMIFVEAAPLRRA